MTVDCQLAWRRGGGSVRCGYRAARRGVASGVGDRDGQPLAVILLAAQVDCERTITANGACADEVAGRVEYVDRRARFTAT